MATFRRNIITGPLDTRELMRELRAAGLSPTMVHDADGTVEVDSDGTAEAVEVVLAAHGGGLTRQQKYDRKTARIKARLGINP